MTPYSLLSLCTALSFAAACDGQNGSDYQGETLADIVGTVTSNVETATEMSAALVWNNSALDPDTKTIEYVAVDGSFPSNFHIEVFTPPPEAVLNDYTSLGDGNARIGIAYIAALPTAETLEDGLSNIPVAISEDYMLVYVESDIAPGTASAELLGEALSAGFYLMQVLDVDDPACPGEVFDCLRVAPEGTSVPLIIQKPEDIDTPNWT